MDCDTPCPHPHTTCRHSPFDGRGPASLLAAQDQTPFLLQPTTPHQPQHTSRQTHSTVRAHSALTACTLTAHRCTSPTPNTSTHSDPHHRHTPTPLSTHAITATRLATRVHTPPRYKCRPLQPPTLNVRTYTTPVHPVHHYVPLRRSSNGRPTTVANTQPHIPNTSTCSSVHAPLLLPSPHPHHHTTPLGTATRLATHPTPVVGTHPSTADAAPAPLLAAQDQRSFLLQPTTPH
jgi:hypothetical protein